MEPGSSLETTHKWFLCEVCLSNTTGKGGVGERKGAISTLMRHSRVDT